MTDPHDIVEQIDVVITGHEDSIKLLKALRTKIAKDRKWKWETGVNGFGQECRYRVPVRQTKNDADDDDEKSGGPESNSGSQNGPGWRTGPENFGGGS